MVGNHVVLLCHAVLLLLCVRIPFWLLWGVCSSTFAATPFVLLTSMLIVLSTTVIRAVWNFLLKVHDSLKAKRAGLGVDDGVAMDVAVDYCNRLNAAEEELEASQALILKLRLALQHQREAAYKRSLNEAADRRGAVIGTAQKVRRARRALERALLKLKQAKVAPRSGKARHEAALEVISREVPRPAPTPEPLLPEMHAWLHLDEDELPWPSPSAEPEETPEVSGDEEELEEEEMSLLTSRATQTPSWTGGDCALAPISSGGTCSASDLALDGNAESSATSPFSAAAPDNEKEQQVTLRSPEWLLRPQPDAEPSPCPSHLSDMARSTPFSSPARPLRLSNVFDEEQCPGSEPSHSVQGEGLKRSDAMSALRLNDIPLEESDPAELSPLSLSSVEDDVALDELSLFEYSTTSSESLSPCSPSRLCAAPWAEDWPPLPFSSRCVELGWEPGDETEASEGLPSQQEVLEGHGSGEAAGGLRDLPEGPALLTAPGTVSVTCAAQRETESHQSPHVQAFSLLPEGPSLSSKNVEEKAIPTQARSFTVVDVEELTLSGELVAQAPSMSTSSSSKVRSVTLVDIEEHWLSGELVEEAPLVSKSSASMVRSVTLVDIEEHALTGELVEEAPSMSTSSSSKVRSVTLVDVEELTLSGKLVEEGPSLSKSSSSKVRSPTLVQAGFVEEPREGLRATGPLSEPRTLTVQTTVEAVTVVLPAAVEGPSCGTSTLVAPPLSQQRQAALEQELRAALLVQLPPDELDW